MTETQWALASVRDPATDALRSVWVEIPVEPRPHRADPFGRAFAAARLADRISFAVIAAALGTTPVHVSAVERGAVGLDGREQAAWWRTLDALRGEVR